MAAQQSVVAEMREVTAEEFKWAVGEEEDDAEDDVAAAVEQLKRSLQAASKRGLTEKEKEIAALVDDAGAGARPDAAQFSSGDALDLDDDHVSWSDDDEPRELSDDDDDDDDDDGGPERPAPQATCATRVLDRIWTKVLWWHGLMPAEPAAEEPQE